LPVELSAARDLAGAAPVWGQLARNLRTPIANDYLHVGTVTPYTARQAPDIDPWARIKQNRRH